MFRPSVLRPDEVAFCGPWLYFALALWISSSPVIEVIEYRFVFEASLYGLRVGIGGAVSMADIVDGAPYVEAIVAATVGAIEYLAVVAILIPSSKRS